MEDNAERRLREVGKEWQGREIKRNGKEKNEKNMRLRKQEQ